MLQRWRGRPADDDGFSLIEVVVALFIIAIVMSGALAFFINSLKTSGLQSQRQGAVTVTNQALSRVQATDAKSLLNGRYLQAVRDMQPTSDTTVQQLLSQDITTSTVAIERNYDPAATVTSEPTVPMQDTATLAGVVYTIKTYINPCYLDNTTNMCDQTNGTGDILVLRATVATTWTPKAPQTCPGGCLFFASTLVDTQDDPAFNDVTPPQITGTNPASVPSGSTRTVVINGSGFVAGAMVTIDAPAGSFGSVTLNTGSAITVSFTASATPGSYTLVVRNPNGGKGRWTFVVSPSPTITGFTPSSVPNSASTPTAVAINGTNFVTGATVAVSSGTLSGVTFVSATRINVTYTPSGTATGSVPVTVTNPDTGTATANLTLAISTPAITSATQGTVARINKPTTVTLFGTGFMTGATVTAPVAQGTISSVTVNSATSVTVSYTPKVGTSTVRFTLVNPDGGTAFRDVVVTTIARSTPTITSVTPASIVKNGNRTITINGTGFETGTPMPTVTVNGVTMVTTSVTATRVIFTYNPGNTTGTFNRTVVVTNADTGTASWTWTVTVTN